MFCRLLPTLNIILCNDSNKGFYMDIHKKIRVHKRQEIECHKAGKFSLSNIIRSISNLIFIPMRMANTAFNKKGCKSDGFSSHIKFRTKLDNHN